MSWWRWRRLFAPPPPLPPQFTVPLQFGSRVKIGHGFYGGVEGFVVSMKGTQRQIGSMIVPIELYRVRLVLPCVGGGHRPHELAVEEWFERHQIELLGAPGEWVTTPVGKRIFIPDTPSGK